MAENANTMPCPMCPADCPRLSETCKVFCRVWKDWIAEHGEPKPKFTTTDAYCNEKNKIARQRARKRGLRK